MTMKSYEERDFEIEQEKITTLQDVKKTYEWVQFLIGFVVLAYSIFMTMLVVYLIARADLLCEVANNF